MMRSKKTGKPFESLLQRALQSIHDHEFTGTIVFPREVKLNLKSASCVLAAGIFDYFCDDPC